jgi:hypothetical protein
LLSPKRKLLYAVFAFAPGTLLAIFLNSVKNRMNEENEALRQEHLSSEMDIQNQKQQKDPVLVQMIEELRARIQELEQQARHDTIRIKKDTASSEDVKSVATTAQETVNGSLEKSASEADPHPTDRIELPAFLAEYDASLRPWLDRLSWLKEQANSMQAQATEWKESRKEKEASSASVKPSRMQAREIAANQQGIQPSGIRERVANREREMVAQDMRANK